MYIYIYIHVCTYTYMCDTKCCIIIKPFDDCVYISYYIYNNVHVLPFSLVSL